MSMRPSGAAERYASQFAKRRSGGRGCSSVLIVAWLLILTWIGFLIYCWYSGAIDQKKIQQLVENVDLVINQTETSFLRNHPEWNFHRGQLQQPKPAMEPTALVNMDDKDSVIIVFSTDCSPYQDWQTLVLFHSAKVVKQKGSVIRIASGCTQEKQHQLTILYHNLYGMAYGAHFTPDFKHDNKSNRSYDFYNKPWGLKHWLEFSNPPVPHNAIIALLDPDMILVRPITPVVRSAPYIIDKRIPDIEIVERIDEGHPAAQQYGLGAPWTIDNHKHFKRGRICGEGSPCLLPTTPYGEMHYSVGPPYIVHYNDFVKIAESWTRLVPRVYEDYPYLLAEMYAYSMASAHERLPHLQLDNYMVSNIDAGGEGWPWVDELSDVCIPPDDEGIFFRGKNLPTVVHYCQTFRAGEYSFSKRKVPHDIFSCEHDILKPPPMDLAGRNYIIKKQTKQEMKSKRNAKRNAYVLCIIYESINKALIDYKQKMCGPQNTTSYKQSIVFSGM